jgi:hypothetical protein
MRQFFLSEYRSGMMFWCMAGVVLGATMKDENINEHQFQVSLLQPNEKLTTYYVFGEFDYEDQLTLEVEDTPGFIELAFDGSRLIIEQVRRPSDTSEGSRFCSTLLPASIAHFLKHIVFPRGYTWTQIESIRVMNVSSSPVIACKCYARVMINMGFDSLGDYRLGHELVDPFCRLFEDGGLMVGRNRRSILKQYPPTDPEANRIIEDSEILSHVVKRAS